MTSRSSIEEVSKRYHQNFLLFVTTIKLPHALQIYSSFCEEEYAIAFFKVVQQQTICKVRNAFMGR